MTRFDRLLIIALFTLLISGCGGGSASNIQDNFTVTSTGCGSNTTNGNQSSCPPGSGTNTSAAGGVLTQDNYIPIAHRVAYDIDALLRQRSGLPPTLIETLSRIMPRTTDMNAAVCANDTVNPVTVTYTGTPGSYTVAISNCDMTVNSTTYSLSGNFDINNYSSTGSSPWIGTADVANISLTYTLSVNQKLQFDGNTGFTSADDGITLTRTLSPNNLRVIIEVANVSGGTDTSYNTFTSGTLSNAMDPSIPKQSLSINVGYYNASSTNTQLDIPAAFLVWIDGYDNPDQNASGTLQLTDSTAGSALALTPVDLTRMSLTVDGSYATCIGWTELAPAGCSTL